MKSRSMLKNSVGPMAAFLITGVLYSLFYAIWGFYPFGGRSVAWCDMEQQTVPLLMELRRILHGEGSIFLGNGGGGMNFWGVFLFFLASPLNLLVYFISEQNVIYFINILTLIKICFCGLTAEYSLERMCPDLTRRLTVVLGLCYSLNGCIMMYYQNLMWVDIMAVFPLLVLSVFRLAKDGNWRFYVVCLSLCMILNYYMSFMIVIFILIASGLMIHCYSPHEKRRDRATKFLSGSLISALITAVIWLPAVVQFKNSGRGSSTAIMFISGGFFNKISDKLAVYSATPLFAVAIVLAYLYRKQSFSRSGKAFALLTIVLAAGSVIEPANKLWQTGSYQAYPLRYGYIAVFMSLCYIAELFESADINGTVKKHPHFKKYAVLISICLFLVAFIVVLIKSKTFTNYVGTLWMSSRETVYLLSFAAASAMLGVLITDLHISGILHRKYVVLIYLVISLFAGLINFQTFFANAIDVTDRFRQTVEVSDKLPDDDFCRVKATKRYFYSNMLEGMGYDTIAHYTSLTDRNFLFTAKRLGYSSYWLDSSSGGGTLLTDSLLMNKYFIGLTSDMNDYCEQFFSDSTLKIYENSLSADGVLLTTELPASEKSFNQHERMETTNYIGKCLFGTQNLVNKFKPDSSLNLEINNIDNTTKIHIVDKKSSSKLRYNVSVQGRKELYFDVFGNYSTNLSEPYYSAVDVSLNGRIVETDYPNKRMNGILDLGTFENTDVTVEININHDFDVTSFGLYSLDCTQLEEKLEAADFANFRLDGNDLKFKAEAKTDEYAIIPFVYNSGWNASVNGKSVPVRKVLGSLMAVPLDEGKNLVEMTFYPPLFRAGLSLSILGIVLFIAFSVCPRHKEFNGRFGRIAYLTVQLSTAATLFVVYAVSSVFWLVLRICLYHM